MLSPPNQGSELVDFLAGNTVYRSVLGPAATELGTAVTSTPNRLGRAEFEVGVITGDRSFEPLSRRIFPGRTDGKVSVARAQVEGMTDFRVVRRSHTFIMYGADVAGAAFHFLEYGRFPAEPADEVLSPV
jgi:hypothetical protein